MNLPKAYQKWQRAAYTDENFINAWKYIVDAYQKAFPDTPTNLDINEPLGKQSDVLRPIVTYVLTTYPRKVYLQHNGLKADLPRHLRVSKFFERLLTRPLWDTRWWAAKTGLLNKLEIAWQPFEML